MRGRLFTNLVLGFVAISVASNWQCQGIPVEDDLTLTVQEKRALDKFKIVVDKYLYKDYMRKDIYLIKWLRARKLNVEDAKQMLLKNFEWRRENRLEGIVDEDFSKYEEELPVTTDGHDYTGRPVATFDISQWDVRRILLSGQKDAVARYIFRNLEVGMMKIREAQERGEIVTQATGLANLKGFNLIQHGCPQCIPVYIELINALENSYPEMLHKLIAINTPPTFNIVLRLILPATSQSTRDALEIYGSNKRDWLPVILNMISPDEIGTQFGGNRVA